MQTDVTNTGGTPSPRRARAGRSAALATALLLTGSAIGWTAGELGGTTAETLEKAPAPVVERLENGAAASYAEVVDRVTPAVVTIRSERTMRTSLPQLPDHPFFREFFGDRVDPRRAPERRQGGMGSGVIVRADGYILTNDHVVNGADEVTIELTDGRELEAEVVGTDAPTDLAVLKVDATNLPTLALGDSDQVRVGDVVLAVGNPLGVGQTVTMGIVSAKGRATGLGDGSYEDFIQTDAPINRGNSGGALVNTAGELVGINSQILTPTGGNIGIGFSIPANMARNVMTQLIDHGEVRRGRLGVTIQSLTPELARGLGLSSTTGALVSDVDAGGPAEAAGLKRGDVITRLDGDPVKDSNELRNAVASRLPGREITLDVLRDGKEVEVKAKLAELEPATPRARGGSEPRESGRFGLTVVPLTPERARELDVRSKTGVVVEDIQPGSPAARAGLRAGDVIVEVDRQPVRDREGLREALSTGDRPAVLLVQRGASTIFISLPRA